MSSTTPGQTIPLLSDSDVTRPSDAVVDEQGRTEPPMAADERRTLLGFLDYQRATLHWKCSGLGADELQVRVADRSEEHTSELQARGHLVCRLLLRRSRTALATLSLHDALPISAVRLRRDQAERRRR